MENSHLISRPVLFDDLSGFVTGEKGNAISRIVWALESTALQQGWPTGTSFGSEGDLIERFGVSREVVREAIRVIEAHGAMRMQRGCKGGLRLIRPSVDQAASALATYLRACGCSTVELEETADVIAPIFAEFPANNLLARLYHRTLELLASEENPVAGKAIRGADIAMRVIRRHAPIPEPGIFLGSEAELCEQFNCCRSTMRQALRILDDLGMLLVRRGRGGGFSLKRPAAVGVMRQMFALLASRQQQPTDTLPFMGALSLVNLRIAAQRLQRMSPNLQSARRASLNAVLVEPLEPRRWALLQHGIAELADSRLVSTLQRCIMAYNVRLGSLREYEAMDHLRASEEGIVRALCAGDLPTAERFHRGVQAEFARLLPLPNVERELA